MLIAIALGLSDFFTSRVPQLQRILYVVGAFAIYFLFTIKYFYGPDMLHYYNYYYWAPTPYDAIVHSDKYFFEPGYTILCSLLLDWNIPFYWFTAIISSIYFFAVFLLFRYIPHHRLFALMILVCLDYSLIFAAFRQCLSVSFFLLMVIALKNKHLIPALLCALLTMVMHKSGTFVVGISVAFFLIKGKTMPQWLYPSLLLLLAVLLLLPMSRILVSLSSLLHLPTQIMYSITHHLGLGKQVQTVFLLYLMLLLCLSHYQQYVHTRLTTIASFVVIGILLIVLLYQSYYLLNRLRSYFLPLIIVYVFRLVQQTEHTPIPYGRLLVQTAIAVVFIYLGYHAYTFNKAAQQMQYKIYTACTVFDVIGKNNTKQVQQRQLELAEKWWKTDFKKGLKQNRVTSL
ncbi:MAG: EpsG family protein [Paludibacteraceae bacterium]|nr:EpsG family protein [Paludibacteraceae bacterium]